MLTVSTYNVNSLKRLLTVIPGDKLCERVGGATVVALQEIRCGQADWDTDPGLRALSHAAGAVYAAHCTRKKGYAGTAWVLNSPAAVRTVNPAEWRSPAALEGRIIVLYATTTDDLPLVFINIYQVNTLSEDRIPVREESHTFLRQAVLHWQALGASIILLGDLNVMPNRGDCFDPQRYDTAATAGTRLMERDYFHKVLCGELGLVDVGRVGEATWFSPPPQPSCHRIDFCLVSPELQSRVVEVKTLANVRASDHVPVSVRMKLSIRRWSNATLEASPAPGLDVTVRSSRAASSRDIRSFFGSTATKRRKVE